MRRDLARWLGVAGLAVVMGCSQSNPPQSVSGKVFVNGAPAARARVFFVPVDGSPLRPSAEVSSDGSFEMKGQDGAKVGEYRVTIIWPEYEVNGGEEVQKGDRLEGRYEDPQNAFARIFIRAGENDLAPFELRFP